jgi:hypothetical protein
VLDNLEQVIAAAPAIAGLLRAAPDLAILATSREPLSVAGEHVYHVPPLGLPAEPGVPTAGEIAANEAVELFVERARAVKPDFELTLENAPAVTGICDALQGAALALFRQANEAAVTGGDGFGSTIATHHLGRELLASGQVEEARGVFHSGLLVSIGLHHDEGIAYTLEGLCTIAAIHGEVDRAGVLAGAAASIRHRVGMYDVPEFVFHDDYLEQLRTPENTVRLDAAIARGREYGAIEAAEYALASEPPPAPAGLAAAAPPRLTVVASASDEAGKVAAL